MKIIFRGYGPTTKQETFERVENWDFRPNYNDVVQIAGVVYTISRIVISQDGMVAIVKIEDMVDKDIAFDEVNWSEMTDKVSTNHNPIIVMLAQKLFWALCGNGPTV
ncbi:MAG: hypothetical protein F2563_05180, partial [Actinobacteria bacterium]|nr:hypothetical protein [Actinomycetota bacterium]